MLVRVQIADLRCFPWDTRGAKRTREDHLGGDRGLVFQRGCPRRCRVELASPGDYGRMANANELWEQSERINVTRADDVEVAVVESRDFADPESFGDRDDGGVGGAKREVGVGVDQLGHALIVS